MSSGLDDAANLNGRGEPFEQFLVRERRPVWRDRPWPGVAAARVAFLGRLKGLSRSAGRIGGASRPRRRASISSRVLSKLLAFRAPGDSAARSAGGQSKQQAEDDGAKIHGKPSRSRLSWRTHRWHFGSCRWSMEGVDAAEVRTGFQPLQVGDDRTETPGDPEGIRHAFIGGGGAGILQGRGALLQLGELDLRFLLDLVEVPEVLGDVFLHHEVFGDALRGRARGGESPSATASRGR